MCAAIAQLGPFLSVVIVSQHRVSQDLRVFVFVIGFVFFFFKRQGFFV